MGKVGFCLQAVAKSIQWGIGTGEFTCAFVISLPPGQ